VDLEIDEDLLADRLTITVRDNGRGWMPRLLGARSTLFLRRAPPGMWLGLPLFAAAPGVARGPGPRLVAWTRHGGDGYFRHSHLDRAPLGDIAGTLLPFC